MVDRKTQGKKNTQFSSFTRNKQANMQQQCQQTHTSLFRSGQKFRHRIAIPDQPHSWKESKCLSCHALPCMTPIIRELIQREGRTPSESCKLWASQTVAQYTVPHRHHRVPFSIGLPLLLLSCVSYIYFDISSLKSSHCQVP